MATFITLVKLTDEGAKNLRNLPAQAQANMERGQGLGIKIHGWYLTQGEYDIVVVADAPDAETMLAQAIGVAGTGNARTQTLRAYSLDEVQQVLQKLG